MSPQSNGSAAPAPRDQRRLFRELLGRLRNSPPGVLTEGARREVGWIETKFLENRFNLVLLGQFKRGKTTLLNSLIGADLLPTGILPVTSIVTVVRHGTKPGARVHLQSGEAQEIPPSQISDFVTERGNPRNRRGVNEVEVFYPSPQLADGLCLIDTPGVGSILEHNTRVAHEFVPRADAAVFVFSPESPLSRVELDFLHHIRGHVGKIFFVLNKVDQVTSAEGEEIWEYARESIGHQVAVDSWRCFSVSAELALEAWGRDDVGGLRESGVPALLEAIVSFYATHGGKLLLCSGAASLRRMIRDELLGSQLETHAWALNAEELTREIRRMEQTWQALEVRRREVEFILQAEIRALETDLERQLTTFVQGEEAVFCQQMRAHLLENRRLPNRQLVGNLENALRLRIAEIFEDWQLTEEKTVRESFEVLTARFARESQAIVEAIQRAAAERIGFHWQAAPLPERLGAQSAFSLAVEDLTSWGLGRFPLLLPRTLFFRYLSGRLKTICGAELDRHAGRLRADLGERLEESAREFLAALQRYVQEGGAAVLDALHRAAALKKRSEQVRTEARESQAARNAFLAEIDAELQEVLTNCRVG